MKITVFEQDSAFDTLKSEWNELLHRSASDLIFCTWEWQSTWWRTYQAGDLCIVTCRDENDRLVGIAPWFIHHLDSERVLRTIGCVDVTDYLDIIADKNHLEDVQRCFAHFLYEHHDRYDRINLCNIPEQSPTCVSFPQALRALGFKADLVLQEVCPVIHLPDNWEAYLESLDKKQRHEIRRKLRRAEAEAKLDHIVVSAEHDIDKMIDQFIQLMRASHPQKAKFLEDPKNLAFFKNLLPLMFERNWLRLSFLYVNDVLTAAYCDFDYNDHTQVYNSGLIPTENAHLSPGIVLLSYNIRDAIARKKTVFDFLRGNEVYKYRMGAQDTRVFMLRARLHGDLPEPKVDSVLAPVE